MKEKELANLYLFGGRCVYKNKYWNVVEHNKIKGVYILQAQNGTELTEAIPEKCEFPPEMNG